MKTLPRFLKMFAHAAALVFGAFWLVATSADLPPPRECFTGLANPTTIAVVLGTPAADQATTQVGAPSCQGLDGLVPGATVVFTLSQEPRPQSAGPGACWSYDTLAIDGATGVQLTVRQTPASQGLTEANGSYVSPAMPSCRGGWTMILKPGGEPAAGHPISPVDSANAGWTLQRFIDVDDGQACPGAFTTPGPAACGDWFPVVSITEVAP